MLNRGANACPGREMNDRIRPDASDDFAHAIHRANVLLKKIKRADFPGRFEIGFFPRRRIEVVEVIHYAQLGMIAEQSPRHMRADKPSSAGQQNALCISNHATIPLNL